MEPWNNGTLEQWNPGTMEPWNLESGIINKYFPTLTATQAGQFEKLGPLYREWNAKINVISRKDIDNLYERHVLHSLSIGKIISFRPGTKILDAGTGGGFPGIPLAILFPETHFHLVDSTAKKLVVAAGVAEATGLANVTTQHARLEELQGKFDFIVSRAVTALPEFTGLVSHLISNKNHNPIPNGILYLKGGEMEAELEALKREYTIFDLHNFFTEEFFLTKRLVHIY
jgi:16S rRNA (guanine527-N7)-methyltransferase